MRDSQGFHAGERWVQARAGELATADRTAAVLGSALSAGARAFIASQPLAALGSVDGDGQVWASLVFGKPGFVQTPDEGSLVIGVPERERDGADPLWDNIAGQPELGMLFIDLGTRRRYRVNGRVTHLDGAAARVAVREAYPNCPRYIQRRRLLALGAPQPPGTAVQGGVLRGAAADIVAAADTLFVASSHAQAGVDVSHRGGSAGFVHLLDEHTLRIPDFAGNGMFNTLGNLHADPRAGLCILDFERGLVLQLTGRATLLWDQDDTSGATGGTGRWWEFTVQRWILRAMPRAMRWDYLDASPFNPAAPFDPAI
jgi:predicted pyridoxine 5'-phosphate oxidase superfamily flavin-nucleotide-binding protein